MNNRSNQCVAPFKTDSSLLIHASPIQGASGGYDTRQIRASMQDARSTTRAGILIFPLPEYRPYGWMEWKGELVVPCHVMHS
jgi:hypothetical protein